MNEQPSAPTPATPPHSSPTPSPTAAETPTARSARRGRSRAMRRDLAAGLSDLHDLGARHGVTRVQLARWAARPRHCAMIELLSRLADKRTALLIATSRADAALMLRRIALIEENDARDVTRKACVDLLKLERLAAPAAAPAPPAPGAAPGRTFTDTELNEAMYEFSRDAEFDDGAASDTPLEDGAPAPNGAD